MTIVFFFPNYERLAKNLVAKNNFELGSLTFKHFPEQESYIKLNSSVKNKEVILICGLENADQKIMALMFFAKTAKDLGATKIKLIAPYLGYMRMDKRFNDGEAITSNIFAEFLSAQVDELITIDPHLHRHKTLEEIYSIPCKTLHAFDPIAAWIAGNVKNPILIGPDSESEQWVSKIAQKSDAPFVILEKIRHGDKEVEVSFPQIEKYLNQFLAINNIQISDIDSLFLTGGTSMVRSIKEIFQSKFPETPIHSGDNFISVANGLALSEYLFEFD